MEFDPAYRQERGAFSRAERTAWELYEARKREFQAQGMDPDDYEQACQKAAAELGI